MAPAKSRIIDYSPGVKSSPSVSFVRIVFCALGIGLITLLTSPYWLGIFQFRGDFLVERKCLHYKAPPSEVVYESDPAAAQLLLSQGKGYTTAGDGAAAYTPQCWKEFGYPSPESSLLFLHVLESKSGERLVGVELRRSRSGFLLGVRLYDYNGLTISPPSDFFYPLPIGSPESKALRFYAGQLDPDDASRFSIRYTHDGKDGAIHGQLSERGDTVTFEFPAFAEVR
jgi:hypothetical protein